MTRISKVGLVGLALIFTLAACSKGSQTSSTTTTTTETSTAPEATASAMASEGAEEESASPGGQMAAAGNASDGAKVYQTNCSSCHQATGAGVPGTFPPLAQNPVVTGDPKTVIHIIKYGLNGKVVVHGTTYNGMMPAWAQQLSDADVANVATYVRSSWGNKAAAISEADVKAVSK